MRLAVAGQGDEGDVFAAGALDVAAADDALRIRKQHDFQKHGGWIGGGTRHVVFEAGIKTGEIKFVVDQMVHGVFESAGEELPLQVNGKKA